MTDNSHIPRRLEGEFENILGFNTIKTDTAVPTHTADFTESDVNAAGRVSLEALINVLIKRGLCTESELLAEENRLHARRETAPRLNFAPVQTQHQDQEYRHHHHHHGIRRWAAKYHWSRRLGTLLFGWKWHRRKKEQ